MADVTCDTRTLAQLRPTDIARCLAGVSTISPHIHPKSRALEFVLVATHGQPLTPTEREWSFPSTVDWIDCRYMERWIPVGATDETWRLRHAYFHLYQHFGPDDPPKEMFAFHWEPSDDSSPNGSSEYNRRPHLHLASALGPLSRSHFVVTLTVSPDSQASVGYLNELLDEVIKMAGTEVLDRISPRP